MKILVTGANGFIGKNICLFLKNKGFSVLAYDIDSNEDQLHQFVKECDGIIHLAGVNRPVNKEDFYKGNSDFTKTLVDLIVLYHKEDVPFIMSSSIQATLDNDYGKSKLLAENYVLFKKLNAFIFRLNNIFGKWCRPNYNSAISTFCYNIARDIPVYIKDKDIVVNFNYIDDICEEFIACLENNNKNTGLLSISKSYSITLGDLVSLITSFKESRINLTTPSTLNEFEKKVYSTYLSYLPADKFSYPLNMHKDNRGSFTEFLKTQNYGQVSVNIAHPGITKGNHYHQTKNEKFLTVFGKSLIRFRKVGSSEISEYIVSGESLEVVDIPPGYTHSIKNIGDTDSVTIMWANELFDNNNPDTFFEEVSDE